MKRSFLAITYATAFCASVAFASQFTINSLPSKGQVIISGKIASIRSEREFTMSDSTGNITVDLASNVSAVLKAGDDVTVTGAVNTGFFGGKSIQAAKVEVDRDLGSAISNTFTQVTGLSVDQAKTVQVGSLPKEGMVKLTGTVDAVKSDKNFVLKDPTGTVDIKIESDEKAALAKGSEVNVIGYVDNGMLGKTVHATHVTVTADATARTGVSDTR